MTRSGPKADRTFIEPAGTAETATHGSAVLDRNQFGGPAEIPPEAIRAAVAVLESLHRRHAAAVEALVRGIARDAELAADVTQTVFVKAAESLPETFHTEFAAESDVDRSARSWLLTVARNETISRMRRRGVERRSVDRVSIPPPLETAERRLERQEETQRLREAVERLNEKERRLIDQHFRQGWTFARIAEESDEPLGTILSRGHRALAKLRTRLQDLSDE